MRNGDFGLWNGDCGMGIADWGMRNAECGLQNADWGLRIWDCGLMNQCSIVSRNVEIALWVDRRFVSAEVEKRTPVWQGPDGT